MAAHLQYWLFSMQKPIQGSPFQSLQPSQITAVVPSAAVAVRPYRETDRLSWDRFVFAHPHGSPFHLIAWKDSIEATFGFEPMYLVATDGDGEVRGVLPLFLIRNFLVKKALLSSPFAVYGGVLADSDEVRASMAGYIRQMAQELGVAYVELRNAYPEQSLGFEKVIRYVTFTADISHSETALLEKIPRKTRRMVRKSLEHPMYVHTQNEWSADFYDLYSRNLRRLGTPMFPAKHFTQLLQHFRGMADIREVRFNGNTVAAVLTFYFRDQVLPYYGASDPSASPIAPNNFMYFDLMRWGGQNNYRIFDFGRSKKQSGGSYDFKAHWGMLERELPYEMLLVKRKRLPHYGPGNPRFQLAIKIWQQLPLSLTRTLGPALIRLVP